MSNETPAYRYTAALAGTIETAWQDHWRRQGTFVTPNPGSAGFDASKPKFYCLDMFPYPSGAGLHVGHPEGYTATDIICRYRRMKGFNVLHPMGYDAFGLPAEVYAIQTGIHPAVTTRKAINTFRGQLERLGFSYDPSREFATIDEDYYRWTQWIFLRLYNSWYDKFAERPGGGKGRARPIGELLAALERGECAVSVTGEPAWSVAGNIADSPIGGEPVGLRQWHELTQEERRAFIDNQRLAYLAEQTVNWCPKLGTALANEEVIDGVSERGGHPVFRKPLRQWLLRITAYAERLVEDLSLVDWPESTRTMQAEWIGRSEGAEIDFELVGAPAGADPFLRVYTTRADTVFGATFMVVAPEHPVIDALLAAGGASNSAYVSAARNKADTARQESKEKTGVPTGLSAVNPATGEKIPVWTADYVLMGYGHGAIMAVPAHDQRDFDFAKAYGLPIVDVIYPLPRLAMKYFAENSLKGEREPERWAGVLADFLGVVVSRSAGPAEFAAMLDLVRARRRGSEEGTAVPVSPGGQPSGREGSVGERRGAIRVTWLDAIEEMGFKTFDDLERRVRMRGFAAADGAALDGVGHLANSRARGAEHALDINGMQPERARAAVVEWLGRVGLGRARVNYRLRDWLFSRQRYWGEPFPIVFDTAGNHYAVSESALPVRLPELADYQPVESDDPMPLLARAASWVKTTAGAAGVDPSELRPDSPVTRETNTMPGWAGSCWYYLRFCDPKNAGRFVGQDAEDYWMGGLARGSAVAAGASSGSDERGPGAVAPGLALGTRQGAAGVDLYIGGAEHAVLHLLYARFWHKVLYDLGEVSTPEPFAKLFHQGLITTFAYQRADKTLVPSDQVDLREDGSAVERATGAKLTQTIAKMSKALKNVVNPDDVVSEYGADTLRLYEMYMGPLDMSKPWNPRDITGCFRFLQRAWRLCVDEQTGAARTAEQTDEQLDTLLHRLIAKVEGDIERLAFNTAIAAMMEFVNAAMSKSGAAGNDPGRPMLSRELAERFALVLSPFAPHVGEELWKRLGHPCSLAYQAWPAYDERRLRDQTLELPVQVAGKVRARIAVPADASNQVVEATALADPKVQQWLGNKPPKKVIIVPGKLVNVVV